MAPISIPISWVLKLIPDSIFSRTGFFTATPSTEWISCLKALVASGIVGAVILQHPSLGHTSFGHHVQILLLRIEEKLGSLTRVHEGGIGLPIMECRCCI